MNKQIFHLLFALLPLICFGQELEKAQFSDSVSIQILGYSPEKLGNETAEAAKNWTASEKEWFKNTFIYRRGHFTVPDHPVAYPR